MDQVTLIFRQSPSTLWASRVALVAKNPPANAENIKDVGWIAGSRRCPGGGHDNPLQYSFQDDPINRGAWATIHRVPQSQT